jgi:hypothetical protein
MKLSLYITHTHPKPNQKKPLNLKSIADVNLKHENYTTATRKHRENIHDIDLSNNFSYDPQSLDNKTKNR